MKRLYTLILLMFFPLINAQTITFNGCHPMFDPQNFVFNPDGTDVTGRNIYTTTPINEDQACSGLGTCEFKILWSTVNSRWEFIADSGNGDFVNPFLIFSNTSASTPNPPSINLGIWVENTVVTEGDCGGNLTSGNSTITGAVQDNILSANDFSITKGIVLYPNPSNSLINIRSNSPINEVAIWSIHGQKVLEFKNTDVVDVSQLQAGMYITRIKTDAGLQVSNFIKK